VLPAQDQPSAKVSAGLFDSFTGLRVLQV
jgi:hypothetical protein